MRGFLAALASLSVSWAWIDHSLRPASSSSACSPAAFLAARPSKPHHQTRCYRPRVSRPGLASRSVQVRRRSHSIISCAEGGGSAEADERLCLARQVHALSPDGEANLMGLMEQYQHQQQQQEEAERIMKQLEMGGWVHGEAGGGRRHRRSTPPLTQGAAVVLARVATGAELSSPQAGQQQGGDGTLKYMPSTEDGDPIVQALKGVLKANTVNSKTTRRDRESSTRGRAGQPASGLTGWLADHGGSPRWLVGS